MTSSLTGDAVAEALDLRSDAEAGLRPGVAHARAHHLEVASGRLHGEPLAEAPAEVGRLTECGTLGHRGFALSGDLLGVDEPAAGQGGGQEGGEDSRDFMALSLPLWAPVPSLIVVLST